MPRVMLYQYQMCALSNHPIVSADSSKEEGRCVSSTPHSPFGDNNHSSHGSTCYITNRPFQTFQAHQWRCNASLSYIDYTASSPCGERAFVTLRRGSEKKKLPRYTTLTPPRAPYRSFTAPCRKSRPPRGALEARAHKAGAYWRFACLSRKTNNNKSPTGGGAF